MSALRGRLSHDCSRALFSFPRTVGASSFFLFLSRVQFKNMVVVKSPRNRETLDRLLGHTNCVLAAEHGAFIRWGKDARWQVGGWVRACVSCLG